MPLSTAATAASFYHLTDSVPLPRFCQGTACFVARHLNPPQWQSACAQSPRLYCLGKCYAAPAGHTAAPSGSVDNGARPAIAAHASQSVVLERLLKRCGSDLASYRRQGGYATLEKARILAPETIIRMVEASQLRGRGGAGYPIGLKWRAIYRQSSSDKYVIANADEGDPGAYIDRFIMEEDPHVLLEAMAIAGHAIGARRGIIYLRREYPQALISLRRAVAEIEGLGGLTPFTVEIFSGQGSYICGEETSLLNSIEGQRPEVRVRPPYPTQHGLFGRPTLVNNVETLVNIPWIVTHGGAAYAELGFSKSRGTKVLSLNSLFRRPGLYEVEFGTSLRRIVEEFGGGLNGGTLRGLMIGGPLAGILPPHLLDTPLGFEELHAVGAAVGHGGVIAFDEYTSIAALIEHVFSFAAYESCGKCTPCRLGSARLAEMSWQEQEWKEIVAALRDTSLCGLGTGLAEFAASITRYYAPELKSACSMSR